MIYLENVLKMANNNQLLDDNHAERYWSSLKITHLANRAFIDFIFIQKNENINNFSFISEKDLKILQQIKDKYLELELEAKSFLIDENSNFE